jgi:hypothetical protein
MVPLRLRQLADALAQLQTIGEVLGDKPPSQPQALLLVLS